MQKKYIFLLPFIFSTLYSFAAQHSDRYHDLSFLKNYSAVRKDLKKNGFKEIYFKTPDGLRINSLFLSRPHATCNVIVCAGWLPGRKEEMATFFTTLPSYCNILFFDARGHGKSEGPLFSQIWKYGVNEHKDIQGAMLYLHSCNHLPIIVCGVCSGAFNAAHAVLDLENKGLLSKLNIRGIVFDSGWGSFKKMSRTVMIGGSDKRMRRFFGDVGSCAWYKALFSAISFNINVLHTCILSHIAQLYESQTNLFNKIKGTQVPFMFIHSYNDLYADIQDAQKLASLVKNKQCWWIKDGSYHACHHLKKRELYQQKVAAFIDTVMI